jgi:hypothetical protein
MVGGEDERGVVHELSTTIDGKLKIKLNSDVETFGAAVVSGRSSQIMANFSAPIAANDVTQSFTGSGSLSQTSASAILNTGTGSTGPGWSRLASNAVLSYTPGNELYAVFTAGFTTPDNTDSYQRAGLYDSRNGFFIGYSGSSFGATHRLDGVDTFYSASAFSHDTLTGSATSQFTRNHIPEAINYARRNVFRIRYGYLGVAPIKFEVLSPDNDWVLYHMIRFPNTSIYPHTTNTSLPLAFESNKAAGSTINGALYTTSWDAGVTDGGKSDLSYTGSIGVLNAALTTNTQTRQTVTINVSGTWTGTLLSEGHNGDGLWTSLPMISSSFAVFSAGTTTNGFYYTNAAGMTQVRVRASAWTSGTASLAMNSSDSTYITTGYMQGNIAAAATDSGNPVKVGGVGKTTQPTAVTDGQRTNILTDKLGRVIVAPGHIRDLVTGSTISIVNSTSETTFLSASANTFHDITTLAITNSGSVGTSVTIRDASAAATVRAVYYIAANGGIVINPSVPWPQTAVNNNWTAQLGNGTVTVYIQALAIKNI